MSLIVLPVWVPAIGYYIGLARVCGGPYRADPVWVRSGYVLVTFGYGQFREQGRTCTQGGRVRTLYVCVMHERICVVRSVCGRGRGPRCVGGADAERRSG